MTVISPAGVDVDAYVISGPGWHARHRDGYVTLAVDTERLDVSEAIIALLPAHRRRLWTLEFSFENELGWDVYLLERDHALSANLVTDL